MNRLVRPGIRITGCVLLAVALSSLPARAQSVITGIVVDESDGTALEGVHVAATHLAPDSAFAGAVTDSTGAFRLRLVHGRHRFRISYVGYIADVRELDVQEETIQLGRIALEGNFESLDEVVVEDLQERVALRGDTTVYNAAAFRVNPDASTENLVAKLPGVVVQDGTVQAQGENVRRVLVDGEEFFGDDALATLRNLPADIVQEIEIYDRMSDQARFTGFDDGDEEKTINIVTRSDRRNGQFGRAFGGYGTESHYNAGAAVNMFDGARRITFIGLANDVNQQNFSTEDLLGVLGDSGRGQGGGGGYRRGGGSHGGGRGGGRASGGADPRDYLVGERDGINRTTSFGMNYVDRPNEQVRVNGSYFFNRTRNDSETGLQREYFLRGGTNQLYGETNNSESGNANHRLNFRLRAELSEATDLTVTPRLSIQSTSSNSLLGSNSALANGTLLSTGVNNYVNDNIGYSSSTNILLRRRFPRRGRTVSANVGVGLNGRRGEAEQDLETIYYAEESVGFDSLNAFRRQIDTDAGGNSLSANVAFTEGVGKKGFLQVNYRPSLSTATSGQDAFRFDEATGHYSAVDSSYTSDSDRHVITQRGGLSYRHNLGRRFRAAASLDVQKERLVYEQGGSRAFEVERSYLSWLPSARLSAELSEAINVRLSYRSRTDAPRVSQLRDVINDTNPLLVSTGNPNLDMSTSHQLDLRFRATRTEAASVFFAMASFTTTRDYVGTASFVAERDSAVVRGIALGRGAQLSYPVNLDGYWSARSFATYGRPIGFFRSNANAGAGLSYSRIPSLINSTVNASGALQANGRLFVGSNISERMDFSVRYDLNYTTVTNSSAFAVNDDYMRHRAGAELNWMPWRSLVLTSSFNLLHYAGLSAKIDPTTPMWNMGIGYKFLKNDLAEVRLTVTDLLNENTSVRRDVTGSYVEDRETEALGRYFMLNLNYKLRHFRF